MNILVLMAGMGKRFADAGFNLPKPLIKIKEDLTIIQASLSNVFISGNDQVIFVCHSDHRRFGLEEILKTINENAIIIYVDEYTQGAACTALKAINHINVDDSLLVLNSDQFVDWDMRHFLTLLRKEEVDAAIVTFISDGSNKWSYVQLAEDALHIIKVEEKNPISNIATVGIYYFKRGTDFVRSVQDMIDANDTTRGEYYLAPCYNYMIKRGMSVLNYPVARMHSLGTPEDLSVFLESSAYKYLGR